MEFESLLNEIVEKTPGAQGAAIVAKDGLLVAKTAGEGIPFGDLAAHLSLPLLKSEDASRDLNIGVLREMVLFTEQYDIIVDNVSKGYFIMLIVDKNGFYGKGRWEVRRVRSHFRDELI